MKQYKMETCVATFDKIEFPALLKTLWGTSKHFARLVCAHSQRIASLNPALHLHFHTPSHHSDLRLPQKCTYFIYPFQSSCHSLVLALWVPLTLQIVLAQ